MTTSDVVMFLGVTTFGSMDVITEDSECHDNVPFSRRSFKYPVEYNDLFRHLKGAKTLEKTLPQHKNMQFRGYVKTTPKNIVLHHIVGYGCLSKSGQIDAE